MVIQKGSRIYSEGYRQQTSLCLQPLELLLGLDGFTVIKNKIYLI